jgi:hypothetical protein
MQCCMNGCKQQIASSEILLDTLAMGAFLSVSFVGFFRLSWQACGEEQAEH